MRLADWLGRMMLLILAGTATLSIIGAIAAIPGGGPRDMMVPVGPIVEQAAPSAQPSMAGTQAAVRIAQPPESPWMEPLTYAVIALAGFAAAGLIVLMRIAAHLGTISARNGL